MSGRTVLTIGNFDGVHVGHAALVREARRLADEEAGGGRVVAIAFHPHPRSVLTPGDAPAVLTSPERRGEWLRRAGADDVVMLEPTREVLGLSPEAFVEWLVAAHRPTAVVEGADFRFGRARAGDAAMLRALGARHGFRISTVTSIEVALSDQTIVKASSTITRWLVSHGRVVDAARVLGRPHEVEGVVVRGDRRGREIGFPTANLETGCLIPADGVYAGMAHLPDGREMPAAIHVGPRATFASARRTVEAYAIGWEGPLVDGWPDAEEYGWRLRLSFVAWLRDQARFEGVPGLVAQIRRDVDRTARLVRDRARELVGA